jgi:hypothetical protein
LASKAGGAPRVARDPAERFVIGFGICLMVVLWEWRRGWFGARAA